MVAVSHFLFACICLEHCIGLALWERHIREGEASRPWIVGKLRGVEAVGKDSMLGGNLWSVWLTGTSSCEIGCPKLATPVWLVWS